MSIVIVLVSSNIKKGESRLCVANDDFIRFSRRNFLNDELPDGGVQRLRKTGRFLRYESHRAPFEPAQFFIRNKDLEKRIGRHVEVQCLPLRLFRRSVKPVQIEIHRDASPRDNQLFQSSRRLFRGSLLNLPCRISRAIAQKQKQVEQKITHDCLKHCSNSSSCTGLLAEFI